MRRLPAESAHRATLKLVGMLGRRDLAVVGQGAGFPEQRDALLAGGKRADFALIEFKSAAVDPVEDMVNVANRNCVKAVFLGGRPASLDDSSIRSEVERVKRAVLG